MKTFNKICSSFAIGILAVIASVGIANAGEVTVSYQPFPSGAPFDTNTISSCDSATANSYAGYEFLFWDNQGTIVWTSSVSICPGSGNTVATAWYLPTGGGGVCPPAGCSLTTWAFSIDHNLVIGPEAGSGTPIALVTPNSPVAWSGAPSTSVLTNQTESVSAQSALAFSTYAAEPFRWWQQLPVSAETPVGIVYTAAQNTVSDTLAIAFYGPDPCQTLRNELASCLAGDGEGGKVNCSLFGKELHPCEVEYREIQ
ncbi:MAG: hypothetical protein WAK62_11730 [Terriglobales bacterium]